jgi:hypothetical protein
VIRKTTHNTYEAILGRTPRGISDAVIRIGGDGSMTFIPCIYASKWDDECWMNINAPGNKGNCTYNDSGTIEYIVGNDCYRYYITHSGSLEYEIVFSSRPKKSHITLKLESKGLEFYYQDQLTEDEIAEGCKRSPEVVGSYAVYGNGQHGKYMTGKFCHIYRPRLIDSRGSSQWCDIEIDKAAGIIEIRADEKWLNDARYPVILDPEIGYHPGSGGTSANMTSKRLYGTGSFSGADGTLDNFNIFIGTVPSGAQCTLGVYYDSTSNPGSLFADTSELAPSETSWNQIAISGTISASSSYWLAVHNGGISGLQVMFDAATGMARYIDKATYTPGTMPDPFGDGTNLDRKYWVYINYTATTSGLSIPVAMAGYRRRRM